jgi:hypothetical protein
MHQPLTNGTQAWRKLIANLKEFDGTLPAPGFFANEEGFDAFESIFFVKGSMLTKPRSRRRGYFRLLAGADFRPPATRRRTSPCARNSQFIAI